MPSMRSGETYLKKALVVHCRRAPYDVYVGRPSIWGNPYAVGGRGGLTRAQAIAAFKVYLQSKPELIARAKRELKGKVLGCFCKPLACHGDILAEIANA